MKKTSELRFGGFTLKFNSLFAGSVTFLVLLVLLLADINAFATTEKTCETALHHNQAAAPAPTYAIQDLYRQLVITLKGEKNPFESDSLDSNTIGKAHLALGDAFPTYHKLYELKHSQKKINVADFDRLYKEMKKEIQAATRTTSVEKRFALLEGLRLLEILETQVDYPLEETTQDEAQNKANKKDQAKDQKKSSGQESEDEQESDFQWNNPPEKYAPENKNLASKKSGKKQVIILRSEAITAHRRYPRAYYDVVNTQGFYSVAISRTALTKDHGGSNQGIKQIHLKNTKTLGQIDNIPVPEGYYVQTGKYQGFQVKEVAAQEYTVVFTADPQTLGDELSINIAPIHGYDSSSAQGMGVYVTPTGINKTLWPKKLLDAIAKIGHDHKSPAAIADALAQHLSGPDYLYFSEGDKVSAQEFAALQSQYQSLLSQFPKPIAMARLGSFNCDGAAWIGAAILRDFFQIPTRVVGGATAESGVLQQGSHIFEVITSGSPAHAWLEIWDQSSQKWLPFDPTPLNNTPNSESQSDLDLKTREEQNAEKPKTDNNSKQQSSESKKQESSKSENQDSEEKDGGGNGQSSSDENDDKDSKKHRNTVSDEKQREEALTSENLPKGSEAHKPSENSKPHDKDSKSHTQENSGKNETDKKEQTKQTPNGEGQQNAEGKDSKTNQKGKSNDSEKTQLSPDQMQRVDRSFDPRHLKTRTKKHNNLSDGLMEAFYSFYLREGIDTGFSNAFKTRFDSQLTRFLNTFKYVHETVKNENQAHFLKKMDLQSSLSEEAKKDLISRLRAIGNFNSSGKLRNSWIELKAIQQHYDELKASRELSPHETAFYLQLQNVLREFQSVKHKDSESFDLVDRLYKALPGTITKRILTSRYPNFRDINNMDAQTLATNIVSKRETDLVRLAMASPYTDLFLNSERIPQYQQIRTFDRSYNPNNPRDVVRTRRLSDFPRMILQPKPGEHLFAATVRGDQFALGYTETRQVPNPKKTIEKKVSVVYYDVSGSMQGDKMMVQDALIMSFVDRALSETDTLGRPVHKVFLAPFDDALGQPLEISTRDEAEQFIKLQRISRKTPGRGGTEIQPVLLDFYNKVTLAHQMDKKNSKSLAQLQKANLVLFSDGEARVDYDVIKKRQEEVANLTGIDMHLSFVSIDGENKVLKDIASNVSTTKGKSTYYRIQSEEIRAILNGAAFHLNNPDAFFFDESQNVPLTLITEFDKLKKLAAPESMKFNLQEFETILRGIKVKENDGATEIELQANVLDLRDAMKYLMNDNEAPYDLKMLLAETALKQYLSGLDRHMNELTEVEHRILTQLVRMKKVQ